METIQELCELMQKGKAKDVKRITEEMLQAGVSAKEILNDAFLKGMGIVGEKFKNNEVFVPEVLIAARAMNKGVAVLQPYLVSEHVEEVGTVVIGTVKGDLHDIGKNLVGMMLKGKGLKVVDLGTDVAPERFIEAAKENNANIIACSALLTTTMKEMENVVKAVKAEGINVKVMVGGAPVSQAFCDSIGADRYTPDAATCADEAYAICKG